MKAKDTDLIDLGQYLRILRRRWLPASIVFVATAVPLIFLGFTQTPVYTAEGKLRFKGQDGASTLTKLEAGDQRGELKALKFQDSPVSTEIGLMRTVPIIQETILRANLKDSEGELISPQQLLSGLNIEEEKGTDVVTVTYQSADADVAKGAVASLLSVYLEQNLLENRAEAVAAREFLQKQLPGAENRARIAEAALRRFKESNQVIALEEETLKTVSSMGDINAKLTDVRSQISDVQAQFSTIQGRVGEAPQAAITSTAASQSAGIQQALAEYQLIEATLAAERAQLQDEHPVVVELEGKLQNLKQLLGGRVNTVVGSQTAPGNLQKGEVETNLVSESVRLDSQLKGLQEQAKNLEAARNSSTLRASVLPKLEQEQRELERRLEAAQSTY
ncbi:MAG: GumC family protein, partial [Thermosynechococcaceae cyanobacterium]